MREIWVMQPRFEKRSGSAAWGLVDQPRFRAAFDFMRLRADIGEVDEALAEWWQEFSTADDIRREDLLEQVREEQKARPRKPVVHVRTPAATSDGTIAPHAEAPASDDTPSAPKKRRRRRKSGATKSEAPPADGAGA